MKPVLLLLPLLAFAGCTAESRQAPMSTSSPASPGAASQEPQPANALPRGAVVDSPLTSPSGDVGTSRVGPSTVRPYRPRY